MRLCDEHGVATPGCYFCASARAEAAEDRWQALKDHLGEQIDAEDAVHRGYLAAGDIPGAAPVTADEIREQWRSALKAGARTMLDALLAAHPGGLTRDQPAAAAGLEKTGGTFQSYLSALRSNGLAEVAGDEVRAADVFFLVPGDA